MAASGLSSIFVEPRLVVEPGSGKELAGLHFAVKDIFDKLLDSGARLVGMTHMDEFAYSLYGENMHYGTPTNAKAPGRVPGGSSSGSAAAVATEMVDFAVGTDTRGSVRVPASFCGVYGIRPTWGRVSLDQAVPLSPSLDTCGWFTRDAALLQRIGNLLLPENRTLDADFKFTRWIHVDRALECPQSIRTVNIGKTRNGTPVATDSFEVCSPEAAKAIYTALQPLYPELTAKLGQPQEVAITGSKEVMMGWSASINKVQQAELWGIHKEWLNENKPLMAEDIQGRFDMAANVTAEQAAAALAEAQKVANVVRSNIGGDAVVMAPTAPGAAPPKGMPFAEQGPMRASIMAISNVAGMCGLPEVTIPITRTQDGPVGLSLIGSAGSDEALLQLAVEISGKLERS